MDIETIVKITARAWCVEILALLNRGVPGRQAPLLAKTRASRTSFSSSLAHLVEIGLLERNPGYGHPLRPEFRLTEGGVVAAKTAGKIVDAISDEGDQAMLRRRWSIPILAVTGTPKRFSDLRSALDPITDRALSASLKQLEASAWLEREIDLSERMPFPTYLAINQGQAVTRAVGLLTLQDE